ncbi:PspA-associated protein PspAB [Spirillospora sp. CA-253888]
MGLLDGMLGRPAPRRSPPDRLFALVEGAVALEAATGLAPTGAGAVCHRLVEGGAFGAFGRAQREVDRLLARDGPAVRRIEDPHGHAWLRMRRPPGEPDRLAADLHTVGAVLTEAGFGAYLLYAVVGFRRGSGQRLLLVHLYGRGTFYPFAPRGAGARSGRNGAVEEKARLALAAELTVEPDPGRRFPVWDAPDLT